MSDGEWAPGGSGSSASSDEEGDAHDAHDLVSSPAPSSSSSQEEAPSLRSSLAALADSSSSSGTSADEADAPRPAHRSQRRQRQRRHCRRGSTDTGGEAISKRRQRRPPAPQRCNGAAAAAISLLSDDSEDAASCDSGSKDMPWWTREGDGEDEITAEPLAHPHVIWRSPDGSSEMRFNFTTLQKIALTKGAWVQPPHFREPMEPELKEQIVNKFSESALQLPRGNSAVQMQGQSLESFLVQYRGWLCRRLSNLCDLHVCPICYTWLHEAVRSDDGGVDESSDGDVAAATGRGTSPSNRDPLALIRSSDPTRYDASPLAAEELDTTSLEERRAPICFHRLADLKEHLRHDHNVDPRDVQEGASVFFRRFKVRETDGLLQRWLAGDAEATGRGAGAMQAYWYRRCTGLDDHGHFGGGVWMVNSELFNWLHHDVETWPGHVAQVAAARGGDGVGYSARVFSEANYRTDSQATWERLTVNNHGYGSDDDAFLASDNESSEESEESESEGEEHRQLSGTRRRGANRLARSHLDGDPRSPREIFARQMSQNSQRESEGLSISLRQELGRSSLLSQGLRRNSEGWNSGGESEGFSTYDDDEEEEDGDDFVVRDEAVLSEPEASDDALDRAEAQLNSKRRKRKRLLARAQHKQEAAAAAVATTQRTSRRQRAQSSTRRRRQRAITAAVGVNTAAATAAVAAVAAAPSRSEDAGGPRRLKRRRRVEDGLYDGGDDLDF